MRFAQPAYLHLLWLLPLIAVALHLFFRHRQAMTARFIQGHLIDEIAQGFSLRRHRIKAVLLMAAYVLMVLALARPQWGYHTQKLKHEGLDIMMAIDVSKSMLTQDVKPSRLARTKLAVHDMIKKLNGDRVGLIAFAGEAFLVCPLTSDYSGFLLGLDDLSADTIPVPGTDLAQAIDQAVQSYAHVPDRYKNLILITDGEQEQGDALAAARKAKAQGVHIYTVGVGTREGDLIQVPGDDGQMTFLKDSQGNVVKSRLNEGLLQQIAYITGGAYVHAGGARFGLDYLYNHQLSQRQKQDIEEKKARLYSDRFQWPLALALMCLLAEALIATRRRKNE